MGVKVGINKLNATESLDVASNIQNIIDGNALPSRVGALELNVGENVIMDMKVSGKYLYCALNTWPARLVIIDISNPNTPHRISGITLNHNSSLSMEIVGDYVYMISGGPNNHINIIDASNPNLPITVNSIPTNEIWVINKMKCISDETKRADLYILGKI